MPHKKANGTKLGMPPLGFTKRVPALEKMSPQAS